MKCQQFHIEHFPYSRPIFSAPCLAVPGEKARFPASSGTESLRNRDWKSFCKPNTDINPKVVPESISGAPPNFAGNSSCITCVCCELLFGQSPGEAVRKAESRNVHRNEVAEFRIRCPARTKMLLLLLPLYAKFRRETGISPRQYREYALLRRAARLLECSGLPIAEIAEQIGIPDPYYFSTRFRKFFGLSPRGYRRRKSSVSGG